MRLENVLAVTGGKLLNAPSISRFDAVALTLKKVTRGALFVARSSEEIAQAIAQGAYGIITDKPVVPEDEEIAWILVDDISCTLPKLLRLWLMVNPRTIFFVSKEVMEFLYHISFDSAVLLLDGESARMSAQIFASSQKQTILCDDRLFLEHIGVGPRRIEPEPVDAEIVSQTLFETSFILKEKYYERLPLVPCMMASFLDAVGTLQTLNAPFTLTHLEYTPSFEPIFVDAKGFRRDFGESDRVLLFADSRLGCRCLTQFDRVRWTRCSLYIPTQIKFQCDIKLPKREYGAIEKLVKLVREELQHPGYSILVDMRSEPFFDTMEKLGLIGHHTMTKGLF
ncbi:hypothetical protein [Hydrogenimonas cancrithermarum]|uniref:Uncharacterized protein n=1 Tax=Hydrogenimonas cancrithermarum TaxID=2993563 RepID=A0ABN6WXK9_9BACT|nr:hypothetical protein [Hydrogenimonas cancrithermarum]BDY13932.1 hypothetical protein HCR_22440 [Hydrogenimonas cancrithermarum]